MSGCRVFDCEDTTNAVKTVADRKFCLEKRACSPRWLINLVSKRLHIARQDRLRILAKAAELERSKIHVPISLRRNRTGADPFLKSFQVRKRYLALIHPLEKMPPNIVLTPQLVVDRSKFPNADNEYTPAQRRIVDRGIAQGLKEKKKGRGIGPFETAAELVAFLRKASGASKVRIGKRKAP